MNTRPPGSFRFAFTAGACLLLLPLKLVKGWAIASPLVLVSSWAADACFLLLLCALGIWLGGRPPIRRFLLGGLVLVGLELPLLAVIAAHTYYLPDAVTRRYSLIDTSLALVRYFLTEVVNRNVLWASAAICLLLASAAWLITRRVPAPPLGRVLLVLGPIAAAVTVHLASSQFYPSVLWEVGVDVAEIVSHPAVTGPSDSSAFADAGAGRPASWPDHSPFDKIIVFVMESVPLRTLDEQMAELPRDHFFSRAREHTHTYLNYFTTNQDSRTGMLSMLLSRIVPFEAYTDADVRRYDFLKHEHSLVDDLAARGYATTVAASMIDEEIVAYEFPSWQKEMLITQQEYDHPNGFLCLNPYEFEQGCEDKILLPKLYKELDSKKRLFLFQEALYGHDQEFEERIRESPVQYYGEHLQAIQDHLAARGELDRTLIVVTSDHGPRDNEDRSRRWIYRLPLLLINPRFAREEHAAMYNQSDFAALLAAEMGGTPPPPARSTNLFIGPTNTSILGSITAEGDLLLVKDRKWTKYVIADGYCPDDDVPAGKAHRAVSPAALIDRFRKLREAFRPGMVLPGVPIPAAAGRR